MIRADIPDKFKPRALSAVSKVLENTSTPIRIDKAALKAPEAKIEVKLDQPVKSNSPPARLDFKKAVETLPATKAQAEYKQPMTVRIKGIEQAIAQRQAKTETPRPEDRKSWFTPASEKTRPLQRSIEAAIKQQQTQTPQARSATETQDKFSRAQERPQKITTNEAVREKIRAEAETKRAQVPPEYRAEPYDSPREEPQATNTEETPRSTFSRATEAENQPKPERPRMSDTFNMKSGAYDTEQDEPIRNPEDKPEVDI